MGLRLHLTQPKSSPTNAHSHVEDFTALFVFAALLTWDMYSSRRNVNHFATLPDELKEDVTNFLTNKCVARLAGTHKDDRLRAVALQRKEEEEERLRVVCIKNRRAIEDYLGKRLASRQKTARYQAVYLRQVYAQLFNV